MVHVGLLGGTARIDVRAVQPAVADLRTRGLGWFLVVIGVAFTGLWLSDVGPSTWGGRAPEHQGVGGTPYAVYVLDLTVALPVVVAVGVSVPFTPDMVPSATLLVVCLVVLARGQRRMQPPSVAWLRPRLWPAVLPCERPGQPVERAVARNNP